MSIETLLVPMLLVLCLVLLIVLLVRQGAAAQRRETERLEQEHALAELGGKLLDELDAQRDESAESLYSANQSLMNTLSQMGQSQSSLLESMQRQVLLSTRNQEEKINDLRLEKRTPADRNAAHGGPAPFGKPGPEAGPEFRPGQRTPGVRL